MAQVEAFETENSPALAAMRQRPGDWELQLAELTTADADDIAADEESQDED